MSDGTSPPAGEQTEHDPGRDADETRGGPGARAASLWARYKHKRWPRVVLVVVIALAIGAGKYLFAGDIGITGADVGACVEPTDPGTPLSGGRDPYTERDCGDPRATLTVLGQLLRSHDCREVPGTTESFSASGRPKRTCLGPKGADPAVAYSGARSGDCLDASTDHRVPCGGPSAEFRVLQRVDDLSEDGARTACGTVASTTETVHWSWSGTVLGVSNDDWVVLCLGPAVLQPG